MFDKFKQAGDLLKLRSQAMELQKQLDTIIVTHQKGSVRVKVTGSQKVDYIEVDGVARDDIKDAVNDAMKEVQKEAAKKMMEEGGGLTGLLGGLGK
jgi:DNA-binding protein YbaB